MKGRTNGREDQTETRKAHRSRTRRPWRGPTGHTPHPAVHSCGRWDHTNQLARPPRSAPRPDLSLPHRPQIRHQLLLHDLLLLPIVATSSSSPAYRTVRLRRRPFPGGERSSLPALSPPLSDLICKICIFGSSDWIRGVRWERIGSFLLGWC
ncbi:unnamed protein product [Alopecurus aequalis]